MADPPKTCPGRPHQRICARRLTPEDLQVSCRILFSSGTPGSGPACHPDSTNQPQPRRHQGWTPATSSATLEPVTAPAGARAAHPPPGTPARDRLHQAGSPTFRGNLTPQDPWTNLPIGSGISARSRFKGSPAHVSALAGPGTLARYPASYTDAIREEFPVPRHPLSCCLSAAGLRFLSTLSRQGLPPQLPSAYRRACAYPRLPRRTLARFPRFARMRPGPGRGRVAGAHCCGPGPLRTGHARFPGISAQASPKAHGQAEVPGPCA